MDSSEEIVQLLRKILDVLEIIEKKLNNREEGASRIDPFTLLELPDNLRTTMMALSKIGSGTASDVARLTGRGRAIESHYLTTLVKMGYIKKRREGRRVIYEI
ncbi:helix-turn-helix domain-containing protein [Geoglobus sp.]